MNSIVTSEQAAPMSAQALNNVSDLYIRVSTNEQAKEGYSIGEQEARLRSYCEAMGWPIHKIHIDPGYSGGNMDRPALKDLIRDVQEGKIKRVVVYKLDRLSRSQLDTLYLIEKIFMANNVSFVSMCESFDTGTPFGRASIGILAVFAQLEREQIKDRMIMGKEARAKEGKWGGGSSEPIGYDYNEATGELEVNEYEKMQILEAVDLFLKGTPVRTISNILDKKGYTYVGRSGRSARWDPQRLKYVFRNKIYLGYINYHGEWYKGSHTPILDEETFAKIQRIMDDRQKEADKYMKKRSGQTTYLGGFLFCRRCGGRYTMTSWRQRNGEYAYRYNCYSRCKRVPKMVKDPNCMNKSWKMEDLDNIVLGEIKKLSVDPEYYHKVREEHGNRVSPESKAAMIQDEISKIDDQISRFMDLYSIGNIPIEQITEKITQLSEKKSCLESELEEVENEPDVMTYEEVLDITKSFDEVISRGELNEIRMIIGSLISRIELDGDDVFIHWKFC